MRFTESIIGDVAEFVNGKAFKPTDWEATGRRIIRIQNLNDPSKTYNRTTVPVDKKYLVEPGDLLVSWSASIGVFVWNQPDIAVLNQHIFRVRPDLTRVDKYYFRYALELALTRMSQFLHGSTMQHINRNEFLGTKIPLPPLEDQRRIAAILDKADAVCRKRTEAIALTKALLRSAFLEMFGDPVTNQKGWEVSTLGNLLVDIESGWSPNCDSREAEADEWGVLKLGAVTKGHFNASANKALLPDTKPRPELEVKPGDLLFSRKNTYELVGASAFVQATRPRLLLPDLMFRLRLSNAVDPVYAWQALSRETMRIELSRLASGSAGSMPNISKARLRNLPFPVPPLETQLKYRQIVNQFWKKLEHQKNSLQSTDNLFKSILQGAFRGEL